MELLSPEFEKPQRTIAGRGKSGPNGKIEVHQIRIKEIHGFCPD